MMVELHGISKRFGNTVVLRDIDLHVREGEFLTLLGPTGCGKSTLLRLIAGFVQPSSGDVHILGQSMNRISPDKRGVGLLFQSYALFPHMTVADNVAFGLRMRGVNRKDVAKRVDAMMALLSIAGLRDRYPAQLSGGQQQRTGLARTLIIEPRVLLLDEPMAALDRKLKLEMQSELKKLVTRLGITTICVSHDQDEALTMSDRIALLNGGVLEQTGSPLELYDRPTSGFAAGFLGRSNLLRGELTHDSSGGLVFRGEGVHISLPSSPAPESIGTVNLLIRPENLCFSNLALPNALQGEITFVTQLGHSMHYEVKVDAGPMLLVTAMRSDELAYLRPGARVIIAPKSSSAYQLVPN